MDECSTVTLRGNSLLLVRNLKGVKLTEKAFPEKLDKLQTLRKLKLNKAGNIRTKMNGFISNGDKEGVLNVHDVLRNYVMMRRLHMTNFFFCRLSDVG